MKDFFVKFMRGQHGFSLVQTLVGAAVIGGLSLVAAQLSKQSADNKMAVDTSYGILDLTGRIQTLVSNNRSCTESFRPFPVALNVTTNVTSLRDAAGANVFESGKNYVNGQVRILGMTLTRTDRNSILRVTMQRPPSKAAPSAQQITKDFFINAEWNGNNLESCASDITNFKDTVLSEALDKACPEPGDPDTTQQGLVREEDEDRCKALYQMREDNSALRCDPDQEIVGLIWDPDTRTYSPDCKPIMGGIPSCIGKDELLRRNSDGSFTCVKLSCNSNQVALGIDPSTGNMRCFGPCGAGTLMVATSNGWKCSPTACPSSPSVSQQYFVGYNGSGDPVCNPLVNSGDVCPQGGRLQIAPNGGVQLVCCTPICSGSANKCVGTTYASDNGCGSCQGTKEPDCSNANLYCTGTTNPSNNGCGTCPGTRQPDCSNNALYCSGEVYTSQNGCGTCIGSKPATDATWGPLTATSEYREKVGATCSKTCGGGIKAAQRKYTKVCNNNQSCGGSPCMGASEEWRDEGTIACNTQACAPEETCSQYIAQGVGNACCPKDVASGELGVENCTYIREASDMNVWSCPQQGGIESGSGGGPAPAQRCLMMAW